MERRLALAIAVSAAFVVTAGSAAVAANLGILGAAADEPVGKLDAKSIAELDSSAGTSAEPIVVTVDEIVEVPVPAVAPTSGTAPHLAGADDGDEDDDGPSGAGGQVPSGSVGASTQVTPSTSTTVRHHDEHEDEREDEHEHDDDDD